MRPRFLFLSNGKIQQTFDENFDLLFIKFAFASLLVKIVLCISHNVEAKLSKVCV